ncbi:MAG: GNAT family N-acetyltransferase [Anaerolineae bacterium]|nr:GNAT family N-acetyltransferase [Anaerolineae bacterium]
MYPCIDGLRFRQVNAEADFGEMARIFNLVAPVHDPGFTPLTAEDLAKQSADQSPNHLVVEVKGQVVGWGSCESYRQRARLHIGAHEFYLLPEWRGQGIEQAVLGFFEARVAELLRDCPPDQAVYKIFLHEEDAEKIALLEANGYSRLAAHAIMVRPDLEQIPDCPLPDGMEIRPFEADHLRQAYDVLREAFSEHIHGSDPSDEDFEAWSQDETFADRSLWVVTWDVKNNRIAGVIFNFILQEENQYYHRQRGYVEFISVLKAYRGRGLARAMIAASLHLHKQRGMTEAALSSHTENPFNPIAIYLDMGFQIRYHVVVYSKPVHTPVD